MNSRSCSNIATPQRLLVTGAEGFVGRHIVSTVLRSHPEAEVIACDLEPLARNLPVATSRLRTMVLDVRDRMACERVVREARPTHVLHAAAITSGQEQDILAVNIHGTENLMAAAAESATVRRCLLLSSSAVYGSALGPGSCDEQYPLQLQSAYARSKRVAELCLPELERTSGVQMLAARLGPCYGPSETPGPFRPHLSLVGALLRSLHAGTSLRIGGEDYTRDWTHLDQITDALLLLLTVPQLHHRIYNVSAGYSIAARALIQCFCEMGLRVQWTNPETADLVLHAANARMPLVIRLLCHDTGFEPRLDWRRQIASLLPQSCVARHTLKTKSDTESHGESSANTL